MVVAWLMQGHLLSSGSMGSLSGDYPFGIVDLSCAYYSPAGPPGVAHSVGREDGSVGGISLRGVCLLVRSGLLGSRRGRLFSKSPILPPSPSSCSSSIPKNHFEDHNIYHELYYGRLFFMFKNKHWLTELYLVYGSHLHVNVPKGQLLYLRCRVSPS